MIKTFSETIDSTSPPYDNESQFREIEISMGSPEWEKLKGKIQDWKQRGGILRAKLSGKIDTEIKGSLKGSQKMALEWPERVAEVVSEFRITPAEAAISIDRVLTDTAYEKDEKIVQALGYSKQDLEQIEATPGKIPPWWSSLGFSKDDPEYDATIAITVTGCSAKEFYDAARKVTGSGITASDLTDKEWKILEAIDFLDQNSEWILEMGPQDWQQLREEIKRWKKHGGILRGKLKGKDLVTKKNLTSDEMDVIASTPGIVPSWWSITDPYHAGASRAIEELGVSALDVHIAVERDYTGKLLSPEQRKILQTGWPDIESIGKHGEYYHPEVGWY